MSLSQRAQPSEHDHPPQRHALASAAWHGRAEPPVVGEGLLKRLEAGLLHLERLFDRVLPPRFNPIAQTGAMAVALFLIACVSGVLVLIWYSSSVTNAYASVRSMDVSPYTSGFVRSLHRYSSDGCMAFVLLHALRLFVARRFGGARALAWVTGIVLVASLWFVGWLGYWLVWDERAKEVARLTATMMDVLPIFADPLSRSFLTDEGVNTLLFFVVFFFHMLVPLAMALPLWLHITRLNRPRFLTGLSMSGGIVGLLALACVLFPAQTADKASMTVATRSFAFDGWYLLPLVLSGKVGPGGLWALFVGGMTVALLPPFVLQRRRRAQPAEVNVEACNGCRLCFEDCPYDAIQIIPRVDGRRFEVQARVDSAKCVGCGICVGSCDPGAIALPELATLATRRRLDGWVSEQQGAGQPALVAFACTSSAGDRLRIDPVSGACAELPGYRVLPVPCAGWVERLGIERQVKRGARVLVVGCGPGECTYREGAAFTELRLEGARAPARRPEKVPEAALRYARFDRTQLQSLQAEAEAFRNLRSGGSPSRRVWLAPVALIAVISAILAPTVAPWVAPPPSTQLVVSFKHPGRAGTACRKVTEEEKAQLPVHMRTDEVCERGRASVQLRVSVDGSVLHTGTYAPRGVSSDGNSVAIERFDVAPGRHTVKVELNDSGAADGWSYVDERELVFPPAESRVVLFDKVGGFSWHGGTALREQRNHDRESDG